MKRSPTVIAYVYGGWHHSTWRADIDEWSLFTNWKSYFPGHASPYRPRDGYYDDSALATAARQISSAQTHGISGFTYFLYTDDSGMVMDTPIRRALQAAEATAHFGIGLTWCLRLPHHQFPIPAAFKLYRERGTVAKSQHSRFLNVPVEDVMPLLDHQSQDQAAARALLRLGGRRQYCIN